jgi:DNA-binding NarL/FixJ family response regulator
LSKREEQVLHLLADGLSNRELAHALKLSEHTVKNHLFRIFDKLGVSNRMEAVLYAISQREQRPGIHRPQPVQAAAARPSMRYN